MLPVLYKILFLPILTSSKGPHDVFEVPMPCVQNRFLALAWWPNHKATDAGSRGPATAE